MTVAVPTPQRLALAGAAAILALIAGTGAIAYQVFDQPSATKYGATVVGTLLVFGVVTVRDPLRIVFPMIVVAAPFAEFVTTFADLTFSLLWPLLLLGTVAALLDPEPVAGRSALQAAGLWLVGLLAVPIADGSAVGSNVSLLAAILLVAWLAARVARRPGGIDEVLAAVVLAAVVQSGIAIWQQSTGQQLNLYGGTSSTFARDYFFEFEGADRPTGGLSDPISLGNVLAIALPMCVVLATRRRGALNLLVFSVAGGIIALALALSLSRMSWVGAAVGTIVTVVLMPRGTRLQAALGVATFGTIVVIAAIGTYGSVLSDRFESILDPTSAQSGAATGDGDKLRLRLWDSAIEAAEQRPVSGVGIGNIREQFAENAIDSGAGAHAHSTYLQVAAEAGMLGVLALVLVLLALWRDLRRAVRASPLLAAGIAGAAGAMLTTWLTDYAVGYLPVAALMAVVFGAAAGAGGARSGAPPVRPRH